MRISDWSSDVCSSDLTNVACDTEGERFACNVFGSTHQVWGSLISGYQRPTLNFFTDQNRSGCGAAQAAMGPFYCPADQGVYLDTAFFRELDSKFGAAGDADRKSTRLNSSH